MPLACEFRARSGRVVDIKWLVPTGNIAHLTKMFGFMPVEQNACSIMYLFDDV